MATAFSSPSKRASMLHSSRGREAPMDFAYEAAGSQAVPPAPGTGTSASPFLAALQSEAARRQQQQQAESIAGQQDTSMIDHNDDDDDALRAGHHHHSHRINAAPRQYPVGSFSALSLHRKRSLSRRPPGSRFLGDGGGIDSRDTTMEDVPPPTTHDALTPSSQHLNAPDDYIDVDADADSEPVQNFGTDKSVSSRLAALLPRTGLVAPAPPNAGLDKHAAPAQQTINNYWLAPFFPNQAQPYHQQQQHQEQAIAPSQTERQVATNAPQPYQAEDKKWFGSNIHHMDWPELLLGHAQFIFNASLLATTLYLLFVIGRTIAHDVEYKWLEYRAELETHIAACRTSYERNSCASPHLGVDFQAQCALWARCAQRNANGVPRAKVFAETAADIANGFVERISWKTMVFTLVCLFIFVGGTNSTLSSYRSAYAARRRGGVGGSGGKQGINERQRRGAGRKGGGKGGNLGGGPTRRRVEGGGKRALTME